MSVPPKDKSTEMHPFTVLLGIAQDGGYPQAGCHQKCCEPAWRDHTKRRFPCCLAIVDPELGNRWLFDCTPSFPDQLRMLDDIAPVQDSPGISGIFLTHAHIGHYAGLINLGCEVMHAQSVPVHVMPRMADFLRSNRPWSLLIELGNIALRELENNKPVKLTNQISATPLLVPHRGEFSETVAFRIQGPTASVLYLPDIDSWEDWDLRIEDVISTVDLAYLDGTFFSADELPGRDMSKIRHPLIVDSVKRFSVLGASERGKVYFLHLNHTNPAYDEGNDERCRVLASGCRISEQVDRWQL